MIAIQNGSIVFPDRVLTGRTVLADDRILDLAENAPEGADIIDADGGYVCPGLIDLHIHGYCGRDASDGEEDGVLDMARRLPENGVTAFLPTTMTLPDADTDRALDAVRGAMGKKSPGARILGVHAEGPFLNPERKGAQAGDAIRPADARWIEERIDIIREITIAPEMSGALDCIRRVSSRVAVSIGHTNATYEEAVRAFDAGARCVTHLFNAQSPIHHRAPGVAGAGLLDDRVWCELIADGLHVSPTLFRLALAMKGDRLLLVTDCNRAGGMPDGEYTLGGQVFTLRDGRCEMPDGTLAGSVLRLNDAVRRFFFSAGCPVYQAVAAASLAPARYLGIEGDTGSIEVGKRADFAILRPDFSVARTIVGGVTVYQA